MCIRRNRIAKMGATQAALIGVSLIAAQRMKRGQPVPYGVFLSAGAALAIFAGPEILSHVQNIR